MKHFTATLMAIGGLVVFASPSGASAQDSYNTDNPTATVSNSSPTPGAPFSVSVNNCPEDSATFTFQGATKTADTNDSDTATTSFTAPSTAGTHTGTATCGSTVSSFSVVAATPTPTVATPAVLPATGSSGSGTTVLIASVLLLAGVGMFGASQMRRRQLIG